MPDPVQFAIVFASEEAANMLVAGIPAAARAIDIASQLDAHGGPPGILAVHVKGGWQPSALCVAEALRLRPDSEWIAASGMDDGLCLGIRGTDLQISPQGPVSPIPIALSINQRAERELLHEAGRRIIAATGKDGDGIVSRHINRPISRAITQMVLLFPAARPIHATLAAALIGLAMFASLLCGTAVGLLAGAVLYQLASIIDGVDGEMARATLRTSPSGALWDSVTDALTNIGFIVGVSCNLYAAGDVHGAMAGAAGGAMLAMGNLVLAQQARRQGGDFTFNGLKDRLNERPSHFRQWLIWLTMRDFYALAACLLVLLGYASVLLWVFALVAAAWLAVLLVVMARRSA